MEMNSRFDAVDSRFRVESRFNAIDARFDAMQRTMILGFVSVIASVVATQL
jgi:hypothetical protein